MVIIKTEWLVTVKVVMVKLKSRRSNQFRWWSKLGGRLTEHDAVRSVEVWQTAEAFKAMTRVTRQLVRILDRSAVLSSVHSIYKNQHLSFISFTLRRNYIVRESLSPIRAHPFTSFSNGSYPLTPFLGKWSYPFALIYLQFLYLS